MTPRSMVERRVRRSALTQKRYAARLRFEARLIEEIFRRVKGSEDIWRRMESIG